MSNTTSYTLHAPEASFRAFAALIAAEYNGIVVKSTQHFYAGFAPIAARIEYISGPGAIPPDFATIPYQKFTDAYWPKVDDPFKS